MEEKKDNKKTVHKIRDREEEDDDCYEIDPINFTRKLSICEGEDDLVLVAEKGEVALRDFPHPRHLCGNFPFNKTSHEKYCSKCFCYVCDVAAPCRYWKGERRHCNISNIEFRPYVEDSYSD